MNLQAVKNEFLGGWKPFEVAWLSLFLIAQIVIYIQNPDSILGMISGISGILCVVFVSKGKVSNYFFGLIFAYTYFYVAWQANLSRRDEYGIVCVYSRTIYWLFLMA